MSAWKAIVAEIYRYGPLHGTSAEASGIKQARVLGLIEHNDRRLWVLTRLGQDWCEGRVEQREVSPGGRYWAATWLAALPRS